MTVKLPLTRFKAVLFDLDGTLIEFKFPIRESRHAMIQFLKQSGFDVTHLSESMRTQEMVDSICAQWHNSDILRSIDFVELKSRLYHILDDFEFKSMPTAKPLPDCLKVIGKLRQFGSLVGIVTNSGRGPVQVILEEYGFLPYMNLVITRNEMSRMKPSPDGLLQAQKILGLKSEDILYVGDSVLDIESARSANIRCASVLTGLHPAEELRRLSPDYVMESLSDVEKLVIQTTS